MIDTIIALLLAVLLWPAPCADAGTCWLEWNPAAGAERYEVWSGDRLCRVIPGFVRRNGTNVQPVTRYWPRPGDGCWTGGLSIGYRVRACNSFGCGGWSSETTFGPQRFRCFDACGEVPCE